MHIMYTYIYILGISIYIRSIVPYREGEADSAGLHSPSNSHFTKKNMNIKETV